MSFALAAIRATGFAALSLFILMTPVEAQQSPAASDAAAFEESATQALTSTEQGSTPISDSFKSRREEIREERREAFRDTVFNWEARTYDLDRINADDSRSSAWAIGGSAGVQTGLFRDLFSLGAKAYTSQPLYGPSDESGTKLLTNSQTGYTVLGEAFAQFRISDGLGATLGRLGIDTPYLSRNDSRMTPQTFEGVGLQGATSNGEEGEVRYGAGYFDKEKQVNSQDFVNMARVAGASVDRGVYLAGASYRSAGLSIGAVEYYSKDIINIAYTEARYVIRVGESQSMNLNAQYTSQQSVGEELLTGGYFSTHQFGVKAELATGPALLTAAFTSTGRGANIQSPWSRSPGYTTVQREDFDLAGENAFMLRAACNVKEIRGLSIYALWVHGSAPQNPTTQNEYDADLQWLPPSKAIRGMMFRARYAYVIQPNSSRITEIRLMLFYTPHSR